MVDGVSPEAGIPANETQTPPNTDALSQAIQATQKAIDSKKIPETQQDVQPSTSDSHEAQRLARKEAELKMLSGLNTKFVELTGREDVKALLKTLGEVTGSDRLTLLTRLFSVNGKPLPMLQIDSKGSIYALDAPGDLQNDRPLTEFKRINVAETPNDERGNQYLEDGMKQQHPFLADTTSFYGKRLQSGHYEAVTWVLAWRNPHYRDLTAETFDTIVQRSLETITQETSKPTTTTPLPEIPK